MMGLRLLCTSEQSRMKLHDQLLRKLLQKVVVCLVSGSVKELSKEWFLKIPGSVMTTSVTFY